MKFQVKRKVPLTLNFKGNHCPELSSPLHTWFGVIFFILARSEVSKVVEEFVFKMKTKIWELLRISTKWANLEKFFHFEMYSTHTLGRLDILVYLSYETKHDLIDLFYPYVIGFMWSRIVYGRRYTRWIRNAINRHWCGVNDNESNVRMFLIHGANR